MIEVNGKKAMIGDLHIHSRFSRACSKQLNIDNLEKWARVKGVDLLGTGDFTHPEWLNELRSGLKEKDGLLYTKSGFKFILSGEVSLMYTEGRGRRVHLVILAPSFEVVDEINKWLDTQGRRDYDGRPIFKISCENFVKRIDEIDKRIEVIPAHVWTPWFGVFGSETGYDSLKEAFGSQVEKVHGIETGISSTPKMNLRLKELQEKTIVSFSDLHSFWPWRLGREATIFKSIDSYDEILREIRENDIIGTIEVNPAYGKYHYDGHRNCNFSCSPKKTKELGGVCPVCKKQLLVGVDNRVDCLAEFPEDYKNEKQKVVFEILPLHELISAVLGSSMNTKKVWTVYEKLIAEFGNEFHILLEVSKEKLLKFADEKLVDFILKNREGKIKVKPGYDGVYGEMVANSDEQKTLF